MAVARAGRWPGGTPDVAIKTHKGPQRAESSRVGRFGFVQEDFPEGGGRDLCALPSSVLVTITGSDLTGKELRAREGNPVVQRHAAVNEWEEPGLEPS